MDYDEEPRELRPAEDAQDRIARIKQIFLSGSRYHDDTEAPPVDIPLLKRYLARQVTPEEDQKVDGLLRKYRPWIEAIETLDGDDGNPNPSDHSPSRS